MPQASEAPAAPPLIEDFLSEPLRVGEPASHASLTIFPLAGPPPAQGYVSLAEGTTRGVKVTELPGRASVRKVVVENPADTPVLLFEGEEVLGAQQNRTFDATILVGAGSRLQIPVSCVEAGRWDGRRSQEAFAPAPQAAHPELRRRKSRRVQANLEAGGAARPDQNEVWDTVGAKAQRMAVRSATGALNDVYEGHRSRLQRFREALPLRDGQSGALVAIGGRFVVCDWVSRPEVFASLYDALLQGYALDALECDLERSPSKEEAEAFVELAMGAPGSERDGIGLGREVRFAESSLIGTGLVAGRELVQLTVHDGVSDEATRPGSLSAGRIRRPSKRSNRDSAT